MMKNKLIILSIFVLLSLILSGCNGFTRFNKAVSKNIPFDETSYRIVSNLDITDNDNKTDVNKLIRKKLREEKIKVDKNYGVRETDYHEYNLYFTYELKSYELNNERFNEYLYGYIDTKTLEVHVLRKMSFTGSDYYALIDVIDYNYGFFYFEGELLYLNLRNFDVLLALKSDQLVDSKQKHKKAMLSDTTLTLYTFNKSNIQIETFMIPDEVFHSLDNDYLIHYQKKKVIDIKTGENIDFQTFIDTVYQGYYYDIGYEVIYYNNKHYDHLSIMSLTSTLEKFRDYLFEYNAVFNTFYFMKIEDEMYLIMRYYGGGLMFLEDYSDYYTFKITDKLPVYIGSSRGFPQGIYQI